MFQDTLWWEWLLVLCFVVIGPLVSYFWIRALTKNAVNEKYDATGTQILNGKFVITNPKRFLPFFVILSIIGLPFLIGIFIIFLIVPKPIKHPPEEKVG